MQVYRFFILVKTKHLGMIFVLLWQIYEIQIHLSVQNIYKIINKQLRK